MQAGQTPPVSNVCHACPHVHAQVSEACGSQAHKGQRIFGPVKPVYWPCSVSVIVGFPIPYWMLGTTPRLQNGERTHRCPCRPLQLQRRADKQELFHPRRRQLFELERLNEMDPLFEE